MGDSGKAMVAASKTLRDESALDAGARWWTTGKAYVPSDGGHAHEPDVDIEVARQVTADWADRAMRLLTFKERSLFRARAPDCGPIAYCSDHTQSCEDCLEHSIRVLLRWGEEREARSTQGGNDGR
jgi:hypothetical protein